VKNTFRISVYSKEYTFRILLNLEQEVGLSFLDNIDVSLQWRL
jgi:hypothetical protein